MLETEFVKSMNNNYERVMLKDKPEENRYQYCIVSRGGIRGLLPCSLRYINGDSFLYYDISSKQSISQIFRGKKLIDREWIKDFVWNFNRIKQELSRFLLDSKNVIWFPDNVYRDIEDNRWSFMYYPYYEGENGFREFLEMVVEKLNHEDEELVEFVYGAYDQYTTLGEAYLQEKFSADAVILDKKWEKNENFEEERYVERNFAQISEEEIIKEEKVIREEKTIREEKNSSAKKKGGLFSFLDGAKKKDKEQRQKAKEENYYDIELGQLAMVAEPAEDYVVSSVSSEEYGKTIYMENVAEAVDTKRRLYIEDGILLATLSEEPIVIGKKKEESDIIIDNSTISRIHARISYEEGNYMLEDLNSTNGTFKNGLRLRPYERRKLMEGDEIRLGSVVVTYK